MTCVSRAQFGAIAAGGGEAVLWIDLELSLAADGLGVRTAVGKLFTAFGPEVKLGAQGDLVALSLPSVAALGQGLTLAVVEREGRQVVRLRGPERAQLLALLVLAKSAALPRELLDSCEGEWVKAARDTKVGSEEVKEVRTRMRAGAPLDRGHEQKLQELAATLKRLEAQ